MHTISKRLDDASVLSGRTMREIADGQFTRRAERPRNTPSRRRASGEAFSSPLGFVEPMMAKAVISPHQAPGFTKSSSMDFVPWL
jgi:hypothetical protein